MGWSEDAGRPVWDKQPSWLANEDPTALWNPARLGMPLNPDELRLTRGHQDWGGWGVFFLASCREFLHTKMLTRPGCPGLLGGIRTFPAAGPEEGGDICDCPPILFSASKSSWVAGGTLAQGCHTGNGGLPFSPSMPMQLFLSSYYLAQGERHLGSGGGSQPSHG